MACCGRGVHSFIKVGSTRVLKAGFKLELPMAILRHALRSLRLLVSSMVYVLRTCAPLSRVSCRPAWPGAPHMIFRSPSPELTSVSHHTRLPWCWGLNSRPCIFYVYTVPSQLAPPPQFFGGTRAPHLVKTGKSASSSLGFSDFHP